MQNRLLKLLGLFGLMILAAGGFYSIYALGAKAERSRFEIAPDEELILLRAHFLMLTTPDPELRKTRMLEAEMARDKLLRAHNCVGCEVGFGPGRKLYIIPTMGEGVPPKIPSLAPAIAVPAVKPVVAPTPAPPSPAPSPVTAAPKPVAK